MGVIYYKGIAYGGGSEVIPNPQDSATDTIEKIGIDGTVYSVEDENAVHTSDIGTANGVAELDANGLVPSSQLPSYVDDVLEYASVSSFPATGETGKIYVATDTNLTYRWSGSTYVEISPSLALGETSSTAYRGDRGKTAYDHATESGKISAAVTSGLYKFGATAQGHIASTTAVAKSDLTALGVADQNDVDAIEEDIQGYKTVTGEYITVSDGAELPAKAFSVTLTPFQEGSGTPSPSNIRPIHGTDEVGVNVCADIQSYYDIQTLVRAGKAQELFKIGDEIPVKYTATNGTQYDMPFRVVAFQNVELEDGTTKQGMFLQSVYATLEGVQFDAPEPDNTLGSGGAKDNNVASYGYNRWSESGIRAWLNSDATAGNWWSSTFERGGQTVTRRSADVAPSQLASVNGFMRGLPSSFVDVLGKVKMQTSCNIVTDGGVTDTTYDKFFLASLEQMYITPQVSGVEGDYFEYWKEALGLDSPSSWLPATYEAYKTYALENHNSAQTVRLRSAHRGYSYYAWNVSSGGSIYANAAVGDFRSAPVCVIC